MPGSWLWTSVRGEAAWAQAIGQDTSGNLPVSAALTKNTIQATLRSKTKASRNIYKSGKHTPSKQFSDKSLYKFVALHGHPWEQHIQDSRELGGNKYKIW